MYVMVSRRSIPRNQTRSDAETHRRQPPPTAAPAPAPPPAAPPASPWPRFAAPLSGPTPAAAAPRGSVRVGRFHRSATSTNNNVRPSHRLITTVKVQSINIYTYTTTNLESIQGVRPLQILQYLRLLRPGLVVAAVALAAAAAPAAGVRVLPV